MLCGNNQSFQLLTPAHSCASDESEHVCLLSRKTRDGELSAVGAHLYRGPALWVPAVHTVGDLVPCDGTEGRQKEAKDCKIDVKFFSAGVFLSALATHRNKN